MGTKFRGIVIPAENPGIKNRFESIKPAAPMYLTRVSKDVLGIGFSYMNAHEEEYDRIGCALSHVSGVAAYYWCHSAVGDGYTLYENGSMVDRYHEEFGEQGVLPIQGATYEQLVDAFYSRVSGILAWNIPAIDDVVRQLNVDEFKVGMKDQKNTLMKRAELIQRSIDGERIPAAIDMLRGELLPNVQNWFQKHPTLLIATIRSLLNQLDDGRVAQ